MTVANQISALRMLVIDRWPRARLVAHIDQLATTSPRAVAHMVDLTSIGFRASTDFDRLLNRSDGGGAELTSVESAVARRLGELGAGTDPTKAPAVAHAALSAHLSDAAVAVALMDRRGVLAAVRAAQRLVDAWQPLAGDTYRALRCQPPTDEATEPWTRPDCENVAAVGRKGLCDACAMRRHRWQRAQEVTA
jgi:hypothetical protein